MLAVFKTGMKDDSVPNTTVGRQRSSHSEPWTDLTWPEQVASGQIPTENYYY